MMIHFIAYSDNTAFKYSKRNLCRQARKSGWFDTVTGYGPEDLDDDFKRKHASILAEPKGVGYWIWKPYVVHKRLSEIAEGDALLYVDTGCILNLEGKDRFNDYLAMLDNPHGMLLFQHQLIEKYVTVKEIFDHFGVDRDGEIANSGQAVAGILLLKKQKASVAIIDEWRQTLDANSQLFTDHYNNNQIKSFYRNTNDQSVFSVICKKHGCLPALSNREILEAMEMSKEEIAAGGAHYAAHGYVEVPKKECLNYPIWTLRRRAKRHEGLWLWALGKRAHRYEFYLASLRKAGHDDRLFFVPAMMRPHVGRFLTLLMAKVRALLSRQT